MPKFLEIGASVNVAELKAGLEDAAGNVRSQAGKMSAAFQELAAESGKSTEQIAQSWVTVAQASNTLKAALAEERAAMRSAKEAADDDTAAIARLGLAKRQAALASQAYAAALKEATVAGVEEEGMLAGLTERLVGSAEAAKLGAGSMAGFAGIAGLLGGGVLIGFFAHLEDEVAKSVVELDHLSAKTGISIQTLAGLKNVVQQLGGEFEPVETGLVRMQKAQQLAVEGNKGAIQAFQRLGISVTELAGLNPEQLFYRLSGAIQDTESHAAVAASSIAIFGKGGAALIPIFKDAGSSIEGMLRKAGEASGITDKAAESAHEWTRLTAELSQEMRSLGVTLLTVIVPIVKNVGFAFESLGAVTATVIQGIASGASIAVQGLAGAARIAMDIADRNFGQAVIDAATTKSNIVGIWKTAGGEIEGYWNKLGASWDALNAKISKKPEGGGLDVPEPGAPKPAKDSRLDDIEIKNKEAHALALLEIERKQYEEDAKLRGDSAQQIEAQLLAFNDRELKIKRDAIAQLRELDKQKNANERDASLAGQGVQAEDQAALKRVEITARTESEIVRLNQDRQKALERVLQQLAEAARKEADEESAASRKALEEKERMLREELSFEKELNNQALEESTKMDSLRLRGHQINARQWEAAEIAAVEQWKERAIQILEAEAAQELAIQGKETVAYQRMKNQEIQIAQQAAQKIEEIQQQEENKLVQTVQRAWQQMSNTVFSGLNSWIQHQKTFGQAVVQTWNSLVMDVIKQIEQIAAKWIEQHLIMALMNKLFGQQTAVDDATSNAEKIAQNSVADSAIVASDAGVSGAAGFASVMAALPFPANVAAAPAVAAAAMAQTLAFGAAAAFETGGIMPRTGMVLAHEKEGILPRPLTQMLLDTANNGGATRQGASRGGNTIHMPITYAPVISHPMTTADVDQHLDYIVRGMRQRVNAFNS